VKAYFNTSLDNKQQKTHYFQWVSALLWISLKYVLVELRRIELLTS
jgi:hypothetical protein